MRLTIVSILLLLGACASFRPKAPVKEKPPVTEKRVRKVTTPVKKPLDKARKSQAVWHLIYPQSVEFTLVHHQTGQKEYIRVENTLSSLDLPEGQWNIESLSVADQKFDALEGQETFQFEIKKKSPTYVGSYVIECPKVGSLHFAELRKMKFFNRLNFTGESGTCELIVGNDLENVRRAWAKLEKKPGSKLLLGF